MELGVRFNAFIDKYNPLTCATQRIGDFFDKHPTAYKVMLVINHLFRAAMMVGFMYIPGLPLLPGMAICGVGSLFYRLTVEKNCAYKFALPAFLGAAAFMLALPAMINMINGVGFTSVGLGFRSVASLIPLGLYGAYVLLTVSGDVDKTGKCPPRQHIPPSTQEQTPSQEDDHCPCKQPSDVNK